MPKPRIAVLLAAHQPGPELESQLQTIFAQTSVDVRVYVGHDGSHVPSASQASSTDQRADLRSRLALPCVRLVYDQPMGSAAQNFFQLIRSVDFSRYDYVALSDQDDLWRPFKLHRAVQVLEQTLEQTPEQTPERASPVSGYSANVLPFVGDVANSRSTPSQALIKSQPQRAFDGFFEAAGPGCTYVISRRLALAFQSWLIEQSDEAMRCVERHDWLLYAWTRSRGHAWQIDPMVVLDYRQHDRNVVGAHWGIRASWYRLQQVRRGWYRRQVLAVADSVDPSVADRLRRGGLLARLGMAWQGRRRLRDRLALCSFVLLGWV